MSTPVVPNSPAPVAPAGEPRSIVRAWVSVAMIPVAFVLAMFVGEGAISALGYPSGGDTVAPLWAAALVGIPVTLAAMVPGALAVLCGRRARRAGFPTAVVAMVLGWLCIAFWGLTTVLAFVDRLIH